MKKAVLFDLGGTLVDYYTRAEFPAIFAQALANVQALLRSFDPELTAEGRGGLLHVSPEAIAQKAKEENYEAKNHRVRPLEGRLARIFAVGKDERDGALMRAMCRRFMEPIFSRARLCPDSIPVLEKLRAAQIKTAVVSNTPCGSPSYLWREELERLGLSEHVDAAVFCTDVGWRKPAKPIFHFALERLCATPQDAVFVGDDPRWDIRGPRALGIEPILIGPHGADLKVPARRIRTLTQLLSALSGQL